MKAAGHTPFPDVSSRAQPDELERAILDAWEKGDIFTCSLKQREGKPLFSFYDGPPYATGKPHYGHVLQSAIKDTVLRYKTMRGYFVPRRVGWDCHGLPVEVLVERELRLKTKRDVERIGIAAFNQKCRETVFRYIDEFTAMLKRLGRWADYEHAYATLTRAYMESEWWVFKQLWEKGLVYKDWRSTPYCIRCATPLSNFEVSMAYREKTDTAVYVALCVDASVSLLVWTTAPWTLPGNVAVAFSPALHYVSVEQEGKQYIVARGRMEAVFGEEAKAVREWSADDLQTLTYERPYHVEPGVVVPSEHVTADEGTGLVHIAPAFGEEDAELGRKYGWPTLRPVDGEGRFTADVPQWAGKPIFSAQPEIVADLDQRGLLVRAESHTHSYPFCWRCDEPLIYYALETWFIRISALKGSLLARNEDINWIPRHVKHGRFGTGIESAPDWAVSRNRFWSVPLPVWECAACGERVCVGSVAELMELTGVGEIADLHRPYVDELAWPCGKCHGRPASAKATAGKMHRVPEVLDVWFDAGSMPYAQWHYPFENEAVFRDSFPADFIVEAIEQTRSWFYVMHVLAVALRDSAAYRNVIASGLIFGEDGQKLSKKLKNYPEIEPTLKEFGADVLRFYLMSSTSLGEPYRLSREDLRQVYRTVYLTLWNVYSFFTRYANVRGWRVPEKMVARHDGGHLSSVLDKWILARLKQLQREVITRADAFEVDAAARAFIPFIDDLSNWYVRRSRGRFHPLTPAGAGQASSGRGSSVSGQAFATLHAVLVELSKLLAPFMPFVTEEIHRTLTQRVSVHLEDLLDAPELTQAEQILLGEMARTREIVTEALALRAAAGIKIRQPLEELVAAGEALPAELAELVTDEVNVKAVRFGEALPAGSDYARSGRGVSVAVALHVKPSAALQREGLARDIIRHGQALRAKAGLALDERITLVLRADAEELAAALTEHGASIQATLQADEVVLEAGREEAGADVRLPGGVVHVGIVRQ